MRDIHRKTDKMKRQKAMYQMKEQDKTPEKQLNELEIGNFPEKEFRIMIVKMIQDLGKRMEAKIENMQEELQSCSLWNKNHIHRKTDKMKRQKAMCQMKEQNKTTEKQINEVEIGNLPDKEFRIMTVKMMQDLGKRMEAKIENMQETFNKDLEELNKQTEMNNTITEMKTTLEGINSRITEAEERISDLENRMVEFTGAEWNKEKRMKRNEDSLRDLWNNTKRNNIRMIGVPQGEEREKGPEKLFEEIIVENFPNMGKEIATQVQVAQRVPYRINPRRNTPRHTVIKLAKIKDKEKLLKAARE